jgi:hypothetical protein
MISTTAPLCLCTSTSKVRYTMNSTWIMCSTCIYHFMYKSSSIGQTKGFWVKHIFGKYLSLFYDVTVLTKFIKHICIRNNCNFCKVIFWRENIQNFEYLYFEYKLHTKIVLVFFLLPRVLAIIHHKKVHPTNKCTCR